MSTKVRLPTLYPMPRDVGQYWIFYSESVKGLPEHEYRQGVQARLRTKGGEEYSDDQIDKLIANMAGKEFVRRENERVLPPEPIKYKRFWNGTWDGSHEGFGPYIKDTLFKWGREFPDGLVLAYDLLTELERLGAASRKSLHAALVEKAYDPDDSYGERTVGEVLRLLGFAGWVSRDGNSWRITSDGRRDRSNLRKRDVYYQIAKLYGEVDPVTDQIFSDRQKIALNKAVMYRECGGKGKTKHLQEAYDILFSYPYSGSLKDEVQDKIQQEKDALERLRAEIEHADRSFRSKVEYVRDENRLERVRDALQEGRVDRAELILDTTGSGLSHRALRKLKHPGPDYTVAEAISPFEWQTQALATWRETRRGTLEVVTGAGKTVFAILAVADLVAESPNLRVSVLVPTKVLMYQWARELVSLLGVPPEDLGLRGDGHKDSFNDGKKVVVSIINSAILDDQLRRDVDTLPVKERHFVIADECHRYRGSEFRKAFEARTDFTLGLSATPGDPNEGEKDTDPVIEALGEVFFRYPYKKALEDAVIQPFRVHYVGVQLTPDERAAYDVQTRKIRKALKRIRQRYGPRLEAMRGPFYARLHMLLNSDELPEPAIRKYFEAVRDRKALVYRAQNRKAAYLDIVRNRTRLLDDAGSDRAIVFHERIENLEDVVAPMDRRVGKTDSVDKQMEELFFDSRCKPVMYHSGRTPLWNDVQLSLFRAGKANLMLSVKALVEGVDVPKANIGIIRTSSSSVRQRIQTTGRILRRASGKEEANLYVVYVRDTTDERIFKDTDWSEEIGSSAILSFHWYPTEDENSAAGTWDDQEGRLPSPAVWEEEVVPDFDVEDLTPGDLYPGKYAGEEYHVDASGSPFKKSPQGRRPLLNPEIVSAADVLMGIKRGGKFVISPDNHIISRVDGELIFLGVTSGDLLIEDPPEEGNFDRSSPPTFHELFGRG